MLKAGKDIAPVRLEGSNETIYLPAIQILNDRGEYSATLGVLPMWIRPWAKKLPWFSRGVKSVKNLAGIAIAAVGDRLDNPSEQDDLLAKLQAGKDETGKPMGREELTAEALTQLIAGSDTTSNSSCAIIYYLSNNPRVMRKLQDELDKVAEEKAGGEEVLHFDYEDVKNLPYLQACIDEALRLHSTSAIGLPRQVPEGGATILGQFFPGGTTVSVPVSRRGDSGATDADMRPLSRHTPFIEIRLCGAKTARLTGQNGGLSGTPSCCNPASSPSVTDQGLVSVESKCHGKPYTRCPVLTCALQLGFYGVVATHLVCRPSIRH